MKRQPKISPPKEQAASRSNAFNQQDATANTALAPSFIRESPRVHNLLAVQQMADQRGQLHAKTPAANAVVHQRVEMTATQQALSDNEERGDWLGKILAYLTKGKGADKYSMYEASGKLEIIQNDPYLKLDVHTLLSDFKPYREDSKKASRSKAEQLRFQEEFVARVLHILGSIDKPKLSEKADIVLKFDSLKACVITALLYAEGGTVLGIDSVEELHLTLLTRFPDTWGQYSDDNVIPVLYKYFGYKEKKVTGKRAEAVAIEQQPAGMVMSAKHMVGFRLKDGKYYFRDNESSESLAASHPKKNDQVKSIWHK